MLRQPVRRLRRLGSGIGESLDRAASRRRLCHRFPALREPLAGRLRVAEELRSGYDAYVSQVSSPEMAASLEVATLLVVLCTVFAPRRVLDLGSGYSSLVLRHALAHDPDCLITSVDDSPQWLQTTERVLETHGLQRPELLSFETFCRTTRPRYDLVFHDLGSMRVRASTLPRVVDLTNDRGIVLFDDVHKPDYRCELLAYLAGRGWDWFDLSFCTRDAFGRWSILATPGLGEVSPR